MMSNWASECEQLIKDCEARESRLLNFEPKAKVSQRTKVEVSMAAEIDRLRALLDATQRDAARYQWLRSGASMAQVRGILNDTPHGIDAAIDAGMREEHDEL